jgi:hypothetical protein
MKQKTVCSLIGFGLLFCTARMEAQVAPPAKPGSIIENADGCVVYAGFNAPMPDSTRYKRSQSLPTKLAGLDAGLTVQTSLSTDSEKSRSSYGPSVDSVYSQTESRKAYLVRLNLQCRRSDQVLKDALVLVQYFGREFARGSARPTTDQFGARAFRLKQIDGAGVTVELPPVRVSKEERRLSSAYIKAADAKGTEFYGLLITVFDSTGRGICQVATVSGLCERGDSGAAAMEKGKRAQALIEAQAQREKEVEALRKNPSEAWGSLRVMGAEDRLKKAQAAISAP